MVTTLTGYVNNEDDANFVTEQTNNTITIEDPGENQECNARDPEETVET